MSARRDGVPHALDVGMLRLWGSSGVREGMWSKRSIRRRRPFSSRFIPQFVSPAFGSVTVQFMVLGLVSVVMNTAVDVVVAFAAGKVRENVAAYPKRIQRIREASGCAMLALGVGLLFARRPAG